MAKLSNVISLFKKKKKGEVTQEVVNPTTRSIISQDYGTATSERVGGITTASTTSGATGQTTTTRTYTSFGSSGGGGTEVVPLSAIQERQTAPEVTSQISTTTKMEIAEQGRVIEQQRQFYQQQYNAGKMSQAQAQAGLNKAVQDYSADVTARKQQNLDEYQQRKYQEALAEQQRQTPTQKAKSPAVLKIESYLEKRRERKEARQSYTLMSETGEIKNMQGVVPPFVKGYSQEDIKIQNRNLISVLILGAISTPKAIASVVTPISLAFKGIQGVHPEGKILTSVRFLSSTGQKGIARGISRVINVEGVNVIKTATQGAFIRTAIKFPSGKIITQLYKPFISTEKAISLVKGESFINFVKGSSRLAGVRFPTGEFITLKPFVSIVGGIEKGTNIFSIGKTLVGKNTILSGGVLSRIIGRGAEIIGGTGTGGISFIRTTGRVAPLIQSSLVIQKAITSSIQGSIASQISAGTTAGGTIFKGILSGVGLSLIQAKPQVITQNITTAVLVKETARQNPAFVPALKFNQAQIGGLKSASSFAQSSALTPAQIVTPIAVQPQAVVPKLTIALEFPPLLRATPFTFTPLITTTPTPFISYKIKKATSKSPLGFFSVSVRRSGKFKTIGRTRTLSQAFNIGQQRVATTLGATFKISGTGKYRTPFGFYAKKTKEGTLFIEKSKYRLSTGGEKAEIKMFQNMKGGIKI
jgi:hypothetical protein